MKPFISKQKERKIRFEFHEGVDKVDRLLTMLYIDHLGLKAVRVDDEFAKFLGNENRQDLLLSQNAKQFIHHVVYLNLSDLRFFTEEPFIESAN